MSPTHSAAEAGGQTSAARLRTAGAVLVDGTHYKQHADQLEKQISLVQ